jgi:hypothetical protein
VTGSTHPSQTNANTGILLISCALAAAAAVAAPELRISPPPDGGDAVPALRDAIGKCRAGGIRRLVLDRGIWHLHPDEADGAFRHVSNHDPGYKRMGLRLDGFADFEVDGQGAVLMCHGVLIPITVDRSSNITLRNLTIDWSKPFHLEGGVAAVGADFFEVEMLPECEASMVGGNLLGGMAEGVIEDPRNPKESRQNIEWNYWIDPQTRAAAAVQPVLLTWNPRTRSHAEITEVGTNRFRIRNAHLKELPTPGSVMIAKGRNRPNRLSPAIHLASVRGAVISDVTIHHAGGMGVIAEDCADMTLRRVRVELRPGSKSLITTTADATHFVQCRGDVLVEDCFFENMLDDALNVHGIYAVAAPLRAPGRLGVRFQHFQHLGMVFARPGDRMLLLDRKTMTGYAEFTAKEILTRNESFHELAADKSLEGVLRPDSIVENLDARPVLVFRNNTVRNNRARSILVNPLRALIENNQFERPSMGSILIEGDSNYWMSSGSPEETIIRGNRIVGLAASAPMIATEPRQQAEGLPLPPLYRSLRVLDNVIETPGPTAVDVRRISRVEFGNNTVRFTGPATDAPAAALRFIACEDVVVRGNRCDRPSAVQTIPAGTALLLDNNRNLVRDSGK